MHDPITYKVFSPHVHLVFLRNTVRAIFRPKRRKQELILEGQRLRYGFTPAACHQVEDMARPSQ